MRVTATVKNVGAKLLRSFFVTFFADEAPGAMEPRFDPLETEQEVKVSAHFVARPGTATLKAKADPQNEIAETDETNNEFLTALPNIPKPDLMAVVLQLNPARTN